ncbi:General transcription factor II-I repeat domain-containing protein 2 [Merluccius polli]|uniref:General transcription factor II-I repeat domain-containing protein 2 n=1 Tax=Merluccius polli TaxID=89951 RepID=A0AA47M427_MERPO|nr:General transcription factor II-I repeat domain-containing protein 2 [Merluccius polli]
MKEQMFTAANFPLLHKERDMLPIPKMAKRKAENRSFLDRPVCLVCGANVAITKEYNIRRHYKTKHHDKYKDMDMTQRRQNVEEMKRNYVQKSNITKAAEIAKSARPFNEGEFVKKCMMIVCDLVCPEKKQAFSNVSLSRNTVADRTCDLATNLFDQLMEKGKYSVAFSLAVDESSDTSDTAQLAVFIRGVDSNLCVTEELLGLKSMNGPTTGKEIFEEVSKCVTEMKLTWDKLVGLTTDGAPAMCGQKSGLVGRVRKKMWEENCAGELTVYHCIIHQEALCGKALKMEHVMTTVTRVVKFIRAKGLNHRQFKSLLEECGSEYADVPHHTEEICQFLESKGKDTAELREQTFLCELAFMCDITSHLDALNLQLQRREHIITDIVLSAEFTRQFAIFDVQKCRFELLSNLFAVDVENVPTNLQMELIELQCSDTLKSNMMLCVPHSFHISSLTQCLSSAPKLLRCSPYDQNRSRLTDEHLCSILRISSAQSLSPDIDELASKKR